MKFLRAYISVIFGIALISCNSLVKPKGNIDVYINAQDTGWYFVELIKDSTAPPGDVEIRYDTIGGLPQVPVNGLGNYNFRIFGQNGEKLSASVRMPAFVYHTAGHHFFRFFKPSDADFANELNWDPKGANMERLREKSIAELDRLLSKP